MSESAIHDAVERADAAPDYPTAVGILVEAGVRTYLTDVKSRTIVYSSDFASYTDRGEAPVEADATPSGGLDAAGIEAALAAMDRRETDYVGMLRRFWQAGAIEYEVNLLGGQITFRGANGETWLHDIGIAHREDAG